MKDFLKDELVTLRALEPSDTDLLYAWENSETIWTISHTLAPFSRHTLAQYIQNSDQDIYQSKQLRLMIDTKAGETVGAIDLFDFDPYHARVGIGILVHNPADRTKGYATAALQLIVRYCLEMLNLHQVYANILTNNELSIRLFLKAGFEITGTKKAWIREGNQWLDEYLVQRVKENG